MRARSAVLDCLGTWDVHGLRAVNEGASEDGASAQSCPEAWQQPWVDAIRVSSFEVSDAHGTGTEGPQRMESDADVLGIVDSRIPALVADNGTAAVQVFVAHTAVGEGGRSDKH